MSKLIQSISGFACVAWVAIWSLWLSHEKSTPNSPQYSNLTTSFSISDDGFSIAAADVFTFEISGAKPVMPADNLTLLQALSRYLGENPDKILVLQGAYMPEERNKTPYPNLGLARAHAIKDILVREGAETDQIEVGASGMQSCFTLDGRMIGGVNFSFRMVQDEEPETESAPVVAEEDPPIVDDELPEMVRFSYEDQIFTLDSRNQSTLDQLRRTLRKDPSKTLIISGYSLKSEEQIDKGNLAERRARAVRRYLVDTGVRRNQILIESYPGSGTDAQQRKVEMRLIQTD